mmetsp:Transcript_14603/g.29987  ORF Transcript_14603/g.29987 Transcript_14603/m.29987 type:complete len:202 (-) Transcript_14603:126-731(-)
MTRTLKCGCGAFQAKIKGDSVASFNCHCHSCVAASRFIDERHGDILNNGHTSALDYTGGCAVSVHWISNVDFIGDSDPLDRLGYVKVGEKGTIPRYYTKCCGTQIITLVQGYLHCGLNRNAVYEEDGEKYAPAVAPVNIMAKSAFNPAVVPNPKSDFAPLGLIFKFIPLFTLGSLGIGKSKVKFNTSPEMSKAEVVPITWE